MPASIRARILTEKTAVPRTWPPPDPPTRSTDWRGQQAGPYFERQDGARIWAGGEEPVLPLFLLETTRLTDLRNAASRIHRWLADVPVSEPLPPGHEGLTIAIADVHPDDFWPIANTSDIDDFGRLTCHLVVTDSDVSAEAYVETSLDLTEEVATRIAEHAAAAVGAELVDLESVGADASGQAFRLRLRLSLRGRFASELVSALEETIAVVEAASSGQLTLATAIPLLRAGHASWLVDYPETSWLDVKSEPWNLRTDSGKIELAQDIARFANERGGVLVVGARTRHVDGGEVIHKLRGVSKGTLRTKQIEDTLDARVYPAVEGFEIIRVTMPNDRELVALALEPQPDRSKPFLVHGAVAGGRVEGAFFSIIRRRGERSIPVTAREVHAWLAAGRSLLDRQDTEPDSSAPTRGRQQRPRS